MARCFFCSGYDKGKGAAETTHSQYLDTDPGDIYRTVKQEGV